MSHGPRIALSVIVLLAAVVRFHDYTNAPAFGSNRDEVAWAWAGQSLIEDHVPQSWSYLPGHRDVSAQATSDGYLLPLVSPWFDHPPTFALVVGAAAMLGGETRPQDVTAADIRVVPILLSLLAAILAFHLARRHFGDIAGWLTLATLCLSPWAVESSRLVESEWMLAPMVLGTLLLIDRQGRRPMVALVALCLLAPTVKVPGIALGLSCAVILGLRRRWAPALACGLAAAAGIGLFALYGAAIDWPQFVRTWNAHSTLRATSAASVFDVGRAWLVGGDAGLGRVPNDSGQFAPLGDPFWLIGVLGLALLALRRPLSSILIAFTVFALVIAVTADPVWSPYYAWYRFAVYPLAYIGVADLVARALPLRASTILGSARRGARAASAG